MLNRALSLGMSIVLSCALTSPLILIGFGECDSAEFPTLSIIPAHIYIYTNANKCVCVYGISHTIVNSTSHPENEKDKGEKSEKEKSIGDGFDQRVVTNHHHHHHHCRSIYTKHKCRKKKNLSLGF